MTAEEMDEIQWVRPISSRRFASWSGRLMGTSGAPRCLGYERTRRRGRAAGDVKLTGPCVPCGRRHPLRGTHQSDRATRIVTLDVMGCGFSTHQRHHDYPLRRA